MLLQTFDVVNKKDFLEKCNIIKEITKMEKGDFYFIDATIEIRIANHSCNWTNYGFCVAFY
jgi:hypothetical protein